MKISFGFLLFYFHEKWHKGVFLPINRFRQAMGTLVLHSLYSYCFSPTREATGQGLGTVFVTLYLIFREIFLCAHVSIKSEKLKDKEAHMFLQLTHVSNLISLSLSFIKYKTGIITPLLAWVLQIIKSSTRELSNLPRSQQ